MCGIPPGWSNSGSMNYTVNLNNTGGGQSHSHTLSANYVGDSQTNLQPYLVLIYIIKT